MSLSLTRNLGRALRPQLLHPTGCAPARSFAAGDKLQDDTRTTKSQQARAAPPQTG